MFMRKLITFGRPVALAGRADRARAGGLLLGLAWILASGLAVAQNSSPAIEASPSQPAASLEDVIRLLEAQQSELAAQRELIENQNARIGRLQDELDSLRGGEELVAGPPDEEESPALEQVAGMADDETPGPLQAAQESGIDGDIESNATKAARKRTKTVQTTAQVERAQEDDPTRDQLEDFVGAFRLPGTDAALRIDGFVKTSIVNSFDPLETTDRFIVGSIPTSKDTNNIEEEAAITANQSRFSFDLREPTQNGVLRAFIEGDFDGGSNGGQYRLRHSFGQWDRVLAGQTWSAFVDTSATPEEIDFEGLNGRVNVRQAQVRFFPEFFERYELAISAEDPNPQVANGQGVTRFPDIVATGKVNWGPKLHMKVGGLYRQVRADSLSAPGKTEKKTGWGLTLSGRRDVDWFDPRDSILFQINAGKGIGRYINDLSSTGDFDGIFDDDGNLELIDVFAGYISAQHWWGRTMRSNLTFGYVELDNPGFVPDDFYKRTFRGSGNLLWSPTPRITVGGEVLWGRRENEDGSDGDAKQLQISARYGF
jgi:hypothetical protein